MLRKPYVVGQFMYSNGVRKYEVDKFNSEGYLTNSPWMQNAAAPRVTNASLDPASIKMRKGEMMFRGQCAACHTREGYRAMSELLKNRDEKVIANILQMLHEYKDDSPYRKYIQPLVGKQDEIEALAAYLRSLTPQQGESTRAKVEMPNKRSAAAFHDR